MAEYVHQSLEEMLPELEEMTRSEVFTPKETKTILKKRESYEYRLRQKTKTKESYLNYIEYEEKLLELIKLRKRQNGLDMSKRVIENSIMERISSLHRLLTTRFPEDVSLWERHIKFCIATNQLSYVTRIYTKILRIHSHREDIWVKAAQFERSAEGNGNPEMARELLLKAQRILPNSETIFLEMYQMELDLATTVLKRKKILNIATEEESEADSKKELPEFKLAQIVAKSALEMFPANPQFHLKMLNVCSKFKLASNQLKDMMAQLKEIYPSHPEVWNGVAMCQLNKYNKLVEAKKIAAVNKCLKTLKEGLDKAPGESMWDHCLRGHLHAMHLRHAGTDGKQILVSTLELFQTAINKGVLSSDLFQRLVTMLNDIGLMEDAGRVAERAVQNFPDSATLWLLHLGNMAERGVALEDIVKKFDVARRKVDQETSWPLWQLVLHLAADQQNTPCLESLMEEACRTVAPEVCRPAKEWCLEWTYRTGGIKNARQVYKSMRCMRPITVEFYRRYIVMEASQLEPNVTLIRSAFEEALSEFGQSNQDLWHNYIQMERKVALEPANAGLIQQRALQSLTPDLKEDFIRANTMIGLAA